MGLLKNKVAIVTGGAQGMGASHVRGMFDEGALVVITDILVEKGQALVSESGEAAIFVEHDVRRRHGSSRRKRHSGTSPAREAARHPDGVTGPPLLVRQFS